MMFCIQLSLIDLNKREKKTRYSVRVCYFGERISKLSRTDNSKTGKTGMRGIEPTIYYLMMPLVRFVPLVIDLNPGYKS